MSHSIEEIEPCSDWRETSSVTAAPASATVAGSRCSGLWMKKTRIVSEQDRHRAPGLGRVLDRLGGVEREHALAGRGGDLQLRAEREVERRGSTSASATITIGARLAMNAPKDRPVWPAMRMFGGSPISVAVPPMLEATISMMISGTGSTSSASASRNVIGTISRIVVTLSRNADSTAVVTRGRARRASGSAARELAGADRQPRVDAGGLGDADHDHHPDEQADRVEVDRLDRLLLIERAGQHDQRRAQQRDLGPVHALGRDQRERDDEDGDGEGHRQTTRSPALEDRQRRAHARAAAGPSAIPCTRGCSAHAVRVGAVGEMQLAQPRPRARMPGGGLRRGVSTTDSTPGSARRPRELGAQPGVRLRAREVLRLAAGDEHAGHDGQRGRARCAASMGSRPHGGGGTFPIPHV